MGKSGGASSALVESESVKKYREYLRALVRLDGRGLPGMLKSVVGLSCFSISYGGKYNHLFLLKIRVMDFLV